MSNLFRASTYRYFGWALMRPPIRHQYLGANPLSFAQVHVPFLGLRAGYQWPLIGLGPEFDSLQPIIVETAAPILGARRTQSLSALNTMMPRIIAASQPAIVQPDGPVYAGVGLTTTRSAGSWTTRT